MITHISQINDSIAVILPPAMVQSLNLRKNSLVDIRIENNHIHILPIIDYLPNSIDKNSNIADSITHSVKQVGGVLQAFTKKTLSIEQMNKGVANHFSNAYFNIFPYLV